MCRSRLSKEEDGEHDGEKGRDLPLQFVLVGAGGAVESLRAVRSHVMKGHHQKSREIKKAYLRRVKKPRRLQVRPSDAERERGVESGYGKSERVELLKPVVPCQVNLVPYAWFSTTGPVLYVNRLKWPFSAPFAVTPSDRVNDGRSVTPRQSHWMPAIKSPDYVPVQGAVLDPAVLRWIGGSSECWRFRVETVKWIREKLENVRGKGEEKGEDVGEVVGAIMTFCMWTAGYRDAEEMSSHMDAIEKIVNLRGGFRRLQKEGDWALTAKLTIFDYTISVLTGKAPRFPQVEYFVNRPVTSDTYSRFSSYESPLSTTGNFEKVIKYRKGEKEIITCLKKTWTQTHSFISHPLPLPHPPQSQPSHPPSPELKLETETETETTEPIPFVGEPKQPYKTHLLTLPLLSTCHQEDHNHVLETIQNAAILYERSLDQKTPMQFHDARNEEVYEKLFEGFMDILSQSLG
ncbi:hypothetical protein HYFRA_00005895 [Hymenoscyphus fraxineus]|uniref:Uncharacterized protein n=1 Tax=Hymenoscyphus fraxineus TaxID=746836 RepID=A0A9N9PSK9_9HELO|nr:hypothetical protein HYFRA_00005895 [Hymenoscyphus fraxineus]